MKKIAVYPGTFDPITYGHIDVIKKALKLFDNVVVAASDGTNKNYLFKASERIEIIKKALFYDFKLPKGTILLCLSRYYPLKNLEIFVPLAKEIKKRELDFKIIVTIHESQHQRVAPFLSQIKDEGLDKIIINVGPVDVKNAPSLYKQCDALLMPSLIETYCLPYVESMHHKRLILTSDMDFSREVCGDAAVYFDPLNHHSILEAIEEIYSNDTLREEKIRNGSIQSEKINSWEKVVQMYSDIIDNTKN